MQDVAPAQPVNDPKIATYLDALRRERKRICASQASAHKFLVEHGFLTPSGKLPRRYGG